MYVDDFLGKNKYILTIFTFPPAPVPLRGHGLEDIGETNVLSPGGHQPYLDWSREDELPQGNVTFVSAVPGKGNVRLLRHLCMGEFLHQSKTPFVQGHLSGFNRVFSTLCKMIQFGIFQLG